jgi:Tfp pilus assembly protein PilF
MKTILNSNLAICFLKKEDYEGVINYASEALKIDDKFKKALLNRAFCYEKVDKIEEAFEGNSYRYNNIRLQEAGRDRTER